VRLFLSDIAKADIS